MTRASGPHKLPEVAIFSDGYQEEALASLGHLEVSTVENLGMADIAKLSQQTYNPTGHRHELLTDKVLDILEDDRTRHAALDIQQAVLQDLAPALR